MYREKILQNDLVVDLLKSQNFESIDNNFCHVVFYDGNNVHPKGNISTLNMKPGRFLDFLPRTVLYEKISEFRGPLVLKTV